MWTTNFYKSFSKNMLLYMSSRLTKIRSVHTYVMLRTVYFGWICIINIITSQIRKNTHLTFENSQGQYVWEIFRNQKIFWQKFSAKKRPPLLVDHVTLTMTRQIICTFFWWGWHLTVIFLRMFGNLDSFFKIAVSKKNICRFPKFVKNYRKDYMVQIQPK